MPYLTFNEVFDEVDVVLRDLDSILINKVIEHHLARVLMSPIDVRPARENKVKSPKRRVGDKGAA